MTTLRLRTERRDAHVLIKELRRGRYDELADKVAASQLPFHLNPWDRGDEARAREWHEQLSAYELKLTLGELAVCDHVLKLRKQYEDPFYARQRLRQAWRRATPAPAGNPRPPEQLSLPHC